MPTLTIDTERLACFGLAKGRQLSIKKAQPKPGDLVYFRCNGACLIGLYAGQYILRPERPILLNHVRILGVAT